MLAWKTLQNNNPKKDFKKAVVKPFFLEGLPWAAGFDLNRIYFIKKMLQDSASENNCRLVDIKLYS